MSEADFDESVLLDESGAEDTLEERIHFFHFRSQETAKSVVHENLI